MTPLETLKALHEKQAAAWKEYRLCSQCCIHDGAEKAKHEFREMREATKEAAFDALPDLLAVVEAAQARQDLADTFTCVADPVGVGRPRHELWDRLEQLDGNLRAALSRLTTTPKKDA